MLLPHEQYEQVMLVSLKDNWYKNELQWYSIPTELNWNQITGWKVISERGTLWQKCSLQGNDTWVWRTYEL